MLYVIGGFTGFCWTGEPIVENTEKESKGEKDETL